MWWAPNVYQSTTSVVLDRRGRPPSSAAGRRRPRLVGVLAGRVPLVAAVGRHPDVVVDEAARRRRNCESGQRHRRDVVARAPACRRPARRRGCAAPGSRPASAAPPAASHVALWPATRGGASPAVVEGVPVGVVAAPRGSARDVDLVDRVGVAVDVQVEPDVEEVLVVARAATPGATSGRVAPRLARPGTPAVSRMPVSLTSNWIVPSW